MDEKPKKLGESAGNRGAGRKKGVPNKNTGKLRDMILLALDEVGGQAYLARQAEENPGPFLTLIGKVLPTTLVGDADSPAAFSIKIIYE